MIGGGVSGNVPPVCSPAGVTFHFVMSGMNDRYWRVARSTSGLVWHPDPGPVPNVFNVIAGLISAGSARYIWRAKS